jgi:hypothetical protein
MKRVSAKSNPVPSIVFIALLLVTAVVLVSIWQINNRLGPVSASQVTDPLVAVSPGWSGAVVIVTNLIVLVVLVVLVGSWISNRQAKVRANARQREFESLQAYFATQRDAFERIEAPVRFPVASVPLQRSSRTPARTQILRENQAVH